ncbi:MAG: hypothetical protein FWG87_09795 [Defluviitaleaceae bacterium]|nr:hypothetical protein [Defluviitaleaceae bacterium]
MNVQFKTQPKAVNERREVLQKDGNTISKRASQGSKAEGSQSAYKVDGSVLEISKIKQGLYRQLTGDGKTAPKTYEQLHSEIRESYVGKEYDKHVAALDIAQQELGVSEASAPIIKCEYNEYYSSLNTGYWRYEEVPQAERYYWRAISGSDMRGGGDDHYLDPAGYVATIHNKSEYDSGLVLDFAYAIRNEMFRNGIESGLALYEKIRTDFANHEWYFEMAGALGEFNARLEALDRGFMKATGEYAEMSAAIIMMSSPHYTSTLDITRLTEKQARLNARLEQEAARLTEHIKSMFSSALAFFKATGSFTGFMDSKEANKEGTMSLRDVEYVVPALLGNQGGGPEIVDDMSGLSASGRAYLKDFYKIA